MITPANPHESGLLPTVPTRFVDMTPRQERAYLNAMAKGVELMLPPGPSTNDRELFVLLVPCDKGGVRFVSNTTRVGAAWWLRDVANRMERQVDAMQADRMGSVCGRLVGDTVYRSLWRLYYATHAMDEIHNAEDPEAVRTEYATAKAEAGRIVNSVDFGDHNQPDAVEQPHEQPV